MMFYPTFMNGLLVIEPQLREDERGYFARIFCAREFVDAGVTFKCAQANRSMTKHRGTIRGMHFQHAPHREDKIITCIKGRIYDVAVDMRKGSATYGRWHAQELTEENKKMFFIPKGFAHGFQTLVDDCVVEYLVSEFYAPQHESGLRWDDPSLAIAWPIKNPIIISEKDAQWRFL